jgi:VWFA-related protein
MAVVAAVLLCGGRAAETQSPDGAAKAQQPQTAGTTLHARSDLVVVDVVVTGRNGKPVHGLKASDFSLQEDGAKQTIGHFEEHSASTVTDATLFDALPRRPPGIYSNYTPAPVNGAATLLLLDSVNTPWKDQGWVRQQLLVLLKTLAPGTRIAIFGLGDRLTVLQGFTSDPRVLERVVERQFGKPSSALDDAASGGGMENAAADDLEDAGVDADTVANVRQFAEQVQSFQLQQRAQTTLDAMNTIAHFLAGIPGRKNLIWFSGSFPVNILPDTTGTGLDPFALITNKEGEFRETVDLLARSQVAVYPIDAGSLTSSPLYDVSKSQNYLGAKGIARMNQDRTNYFNDLGQNHETMVRMAEATGGRAFLNPGGLAQTVATAVEEGSNFYTLTYMPAKPVGDGRFRKIKLEVTKPGVTLAYRHGYYAYDAAAQNSPRRAKLIDTAVSGGADAGTMQMAITRGAPVPTEILMKAGVYPVGAASEMTEAAATDNVPRVKGPYRDFSVTYAIDPAGICFLSDGAGNARADFEVAVMVFDAEGKLVNSVGDTVHMSASVQDTLRAVATGIHYNQRISVPVPGEYFLRLAVHDLNRDHYGAIELAVAEVKNLPVPKAVDAAQGR